MILVDNDSTDKQALVKSLKSEIALLQGKMEVDHDASCLSLMAVRHGV